MKYIDRLQKPKWILLTGLKENKNRWEKPY